MKVLLKANPAVQRVQNFCYSNSSVHNWYCQNAAIPLVTHKQSMVKSHTAFSMVSALWGGARAGLQTELEPKPGLGRCCVFWHGRDGWEGLQTPPHHSTWDCHAMKLAPIWYLTRSVQHRRATECNAEAFLPWPWCDTCHQPWNKLVTPHTARGTVKAQHSVSSMCCCVQSVPRIFSSWFFFLRSLLSYKSNCCQYDLASVFQAPYKAMMRQSPFCWNSIELPSSNPRWHACGFLFEGKKQKTYSES